MTEDPGIPAVARVSAPAVPGISFQAEPSGGGADHLPLHVTTS
jgi:hypothetical protein